MAQIIAKFGYLKGKSRGGYAKYIATREGVEKLDESLRDRPVTQSQQEFINCIFRPSESKETVGVSPPSREKQVQVHGRESTGVLFGKKWQRNASQSAPPRVIYSDWNPFLLRMESSPSMRIL